MDKEKFVELSMYEDNSSLSRILGSSLDKATAFVKHFDSQANIIVGFSSAVAFFAVTMLKSGLPRLPFLTLALFATLSVLVGLYSIHPPRFMRKKGQEESLLYSKKVIGFSSGKVYAEAFTEMVKNKDEVVKNFSTEIYNLYKYYYQPKRKLFNYSRNLLVAGIILGTILFLIS